MEIISVRVAPDAHAYAILQRHALSLARCGKLGREKIRSSPYFHFWDFHVLTSPNTLDHAMDLLRLHSIHCCLL